MSKPNENTPAGTAPTWILVAGRARARLLEMASRDDASELTEIRDFVNPEGRGSERDQVSERLPRTHERMGATRHAIEPRTSLRDKSANRFAEELCEALERGRVENRYERLVLVALPHFLGTLHARLDRQVRERIVAEVPHDLTTKKPVQIRSYLADKLHGQAAGPAAARIQAQHREPT